MEVFGYIIDVDGSIYAIILFLALRYRDKVLDGLPKFFDGLLCSAGFTAMLLLPFKKSLFTLKPIEISGVAIGVFILAGVVYFVANRASTDRDKKIKNDQSLDQLICEFVAEYEGSKPSFHNKKKEKYLSSIEKHERNFSSIFNSRVLPEIAKEGITVPPYMLDQRRWTEIRDFVLNKLKEITSEEDDKKPLPVKIEIANFGSSASKESEGKIIQTTNGLISSSFNENTEVFVEIRHRAIINQIAKESQYLCTQGFTLSSQNDQKIELLSVVMTVEENDFLKMKVKNGLVDCSEGYASEIHSSLCTKFAKLKQQRGTAHEIDFIFSKPGFKNIMFTLFINSNGFPQKSKPSDWPKYPNNFKI